MKHTPHGYWLEEAGPVAPVPPLVGERSADVVVVGGGFTGLWAAWYLRRLEPEARIVLLEGGETCGRGPSGRNGGFCNALWFSLASMRARWGDEAAVAVAEAAEQAVERIGEFCAEHGVDAWFRPASYVQVSTAGAHDGAWGAALAACRDLGFVGRLAPLSEAEVDSICRSTAFRGGAVAAGSATVQPARLALGLRRHLIEQGVEVYESSPVRALRESAAGVEAETAAGTVNATSAVMAIGAAAKRRGAPFHGRLTVASSHIVLTEPVPDVIEEIGWSGGECITDACALLDYFRTTPDGRIAFGWGGGRIAMGARLGGRAELDPSVVASAAARLREYFPALAGRRITHAWGGPIDASPTHLPSILSTAGGRAFAAAGYTGNGVGPSNMVGRSLASLALDRRDDASRLAFVDAQPPRLPPEPLQWAGGEAIRLALRRKEEAERAGRLPGHVAAALARVPQLIGFHIGR